MHQKTDRDLGLRRDRLIQEHIHDSYKTPEKLPEPTVCPECGAVFREGRWQWISPPPARAKHVVCQACHRKRDMYPAGIITFTGSYVHHHKNELLRLARNREAGEKRAHPLHRIMSVEEYPDSLVIKTTDIHLPHNIAEAVQGACHGKLKIQYDREGYFVRVDWHRQS